MIRSKIEKSISYSKIHYLWYSIILLFPPCHEFGHAVIAFLCGDKVISYGFWYVVYAQSNVYHSILFQELWQYSIFIPLFCVCVWAYLMLKKMDVHLKGVRLFYGSETNNI